MSFHVEKFCVAFAICLLTASTLGCVSSDRWRDGRPPVHPTSGSLQVDGKPVEGAIITFQPVDAVNGKPGSAVTDKNGYFQVQTFDPGDGLTEGKHRVAFKKTQMVDRATGKVVTEVASDAPLREEHLVPKKYSEFETSGIEVEIKKGKNKLAAFEINSK